MQGYGGDLEERNLDQPAGLGLDLAPAARTRACPKCSTPHVIGAPSCARCGVHFAALRLKQQLAAQAKPRYAAGPPEPASTLARGRGARPGEPAAPPKQASPMWAIALLAVVALCVAFFLIAT
jgi:hypothetical protein